MMSFFPFLRPSCASAPSVFLAAMLLSLSARANAEAAYSIQVGAFPTQEAAETARQAFAASYSPTYVWNKDGSTTPTTSRPFKVLLGQFPYYAAAYAHKAKLREGVAPGCFIVKWNPPDPAPASQALPVDLPFDATDLAPSVVAPPTAHWDAVGLPLEDTLPVDEFTVVLLEASALPREDVLVIATEASSPTVAVVAQDVFIQDFHVDPDLNRVRLKKAKTVGAANLTESTALLDQVAASGTQHEKAVGRLIRAYVTDKSKQRAAARDQFRTLAGDRSLLPSLRRDAMRRVAGISHALHNYPDAWLAYEQIEKTTDDPAVAAEARMARAGLAFELTGRGKGTWEEVRALCESVPTMPQAPRRVRATAALMHLETWFNQEQYNASLAEANALLATYPDIPREWYMAKVWKGISLYRLDRIAEARPVLQQILAAQIPNSEKFGGVEPRARAALWLAFLENGEGNFEARDAVVRLIQAQYPASKECMEVTQLYGTPPAP